MITVVGLKIVGGLGLKKQTIKICFLGKRFQFEFYFTKQKKNIFKRNNLGSVGRTFQGHNKIHFHILKQLSNPELPYLLSNYK